MFEVLLKHDAAHYDSCELGIVHDVTARVNGQGPFHELFRMSVAKPVGVTASMIVFTSLLSDMV